MLVGISTIKEAILVSLHRINDIWVQNENWSELIYTLSPITLVTF